MLNNNLHANLKCIHIPSMRHMQASYLSKFWVDKHQVHQPESHLLGGINNYTMYSKSKIWGKTMQKWGCCAELQTSALGIFSNTHLLLRALDVCTVETIQLNLQETCSEVECVHIWGQASLPFPLSFMYCCEHKPKGKQWERSGNKARSYIHFPKLNVTYKFELLCT